MWVTAGLMRLVSFATKDAPPVAGETGRRGNGEIGRRATFDRPDRSQGGYKKHKLQRYEGPERRRVARLRPRATERRNITPQHHTVAQFLTDS